MKIYSDTITESDVLKAFRDARSIDGQDIHIDDIRRFRPRKGGNGVEVYAESMTGTRATGHALVGSYPRTDLPRAASWSAYGYVIARLFNLDPDARIGPYQGVADFTTRTVSYTPRGQHADFLEVLT